MSPGRKAGPEGPAGIESSVHVVVVSFVSFSYLCLFHQCNRKNDLKTVKWTKKFLPFSKKRKLLKRICLFASMELGLPE